MCELLEHFFCRNGFQIALLVNRTTVSKVEQVGELLRKWILTFVNLHMHQHEMKGKSMGVEVH